jgi:hypothetical protein
MACELSLAVLDPLARGRDTHGVRNTMPELAKDELAVSQRWLRVNGCDYGFNRGMALDCKARRRWLGWSTSENS